MSKIGIVILTYNSGKNIKECLESLEKSTYKDFTVVVVDNASTDGTAEYLKSQSVDSILNDKNVGFAAGNNIGIKYLLNKKSCEYVMLLNDDTIASPNLIEKLFKVFKSHDSVGISGPIITFFDNPQKIWYAGGYFNNTFCFTKHPHMNKNISEVTITGGETDFITGCGMMIKKEVFEKIGFLDESYFMYFEDCSFCIKAKEYGYKSYLVAEPLILHKVSSSAGNSGSNKLSPLQAYYFAKNSLIFIKKDKKLMFTRYLGQFLIRLPFYTLQMFRDKKFKSILSYFRGIIDGL